MASEGTGRAEFDAGFDWRLAVREYRKKHRLSQPEVARRSGLSVSAIKSYESGNRHPSREALAAIVDALGMPVEEANPVLAGAGYAIDWQAILNQRYEPRDVQWYTDEVEKYSWPVFVTNQAADLMAANRALRTVVGIPLGDQLPNPAKWNWVARASDPEFARRQENWDEAMCFVIGIAKGDQRRDMNPERMAPYVNEAFKQFFEGDPVYLQRMLKLWEQAEPVAHTTRMHYSVRWRHDSGVLMRFTATMHVADVWQELSWHDWVPLDEDTVRLLGE